MSDQDLDVENNNAGPTEKEDWIQDSYSEEISTEGIVTNTENESEGK